MERKWRCEYCNIEIIFNISRINNHIKSTLHKENVFSMKGIKISGQTINCKRMNGDIFDTTMPLVSKVIILKLNLCTLRKMILYYKWGVFIKMIYI